MVVAAGLARRQKGGSVTRDELVEVARYHIDKCCTGGTEEDWEAAERIVHDLLRHVCESLETYYHPQAGERNMHPADYITKRFALDGHEGLRYV